jgi:cytochrome c oxidase cbb3-type subunit 4
MSLAILRDIGTVTAFIAFIGICLWAYSANRKADFDAAANLPFADDESPEERK